MKEYRSVFRFHGFPDIGKEKKRTELPFGLMLGDAKLPFLFLFIYLFSWFILQTVAMKGVEPGVVAHV